MTYRNDYDNNCYEREYEEKECRQCKEKEGATKNYEKNYKVKGNCCKVVNKHYHNNYYTRYNDITVTDCHYVKNYVKDCNVYHHNTETVNCGTKYLGASSVCDYSDKCEKPCKPDFDCDHGANSCKCLIENNPCEKKCCNESSKEGSYWCDCPKDDDHDCDSKKEDNNYWF